MKILNGEKKNNFFLHLTGFLALLWFLIRVIPKPSRASYPCQRAAFPIASAFVLWLTGIIVSYFSFKKALKYFKKSKYGLAITFTMSAILVFFITQFQGSIRDSIAAASYQQVNLQDFYSDSSSYQPKAVVSIIRSEKEKAEEIDSLEIYDMVRQAVEMAGGFDNLIHDSSTVILKPNLLTAWVVDGNLSKKSVLQEKLNSVTTDYRVIQGVVNLVREKNPHGKIYIVEGSAIGKTRDNMSKMGWFKVTGVDKFYCLDESECGAWRDENAEELIKLSLPEDKRLYKFGENKYFLNKIYYDADVLISLPALKTHSDAAFTGAVKNVGIGGAPVSIYGSSSSNPWRFDVIHHDGTNQVNLHNWIHDFYMCRPVDFTIMDALTGMQDGPCPLTINPRTLQKKNTRCIMASKDPIALDAIGSLMVQVDPSKVRHLVTLHNDKLGCADPKYIKVVGKRVDEVKDHYSNMSNYANYSDFTPPNASINSYKLTSDSLYINLNTISDLAKIEITINNEFLSAIYSCESNNISIKLDTQVTDPDQIRIYAYDRFLNCKVIDLKTTGVKSNVQPAKYLLLQNYPNPFNPETIIQYSVPKFGSANVVFVQLKIYDLLSNEIKTLVNKEQAPGEYKIKFDGLNLSSGTYICQITAGGLSKTNKMLLLK